MTTVLEARAVITAEDKTAAAFAAIEKRMQSLSKAAAEIGKISTPMAASAADVGRYMAPVDKATKAVRNYSQMMSEAATQSRAFAAAQKNVGESIELGTRAAARAKAVYNAKSLGGTAGMLATPLIAHEATRIASAVKETYREFDKERRFQKAVMGLSDADQAPLVSQAIRGGATTKFNDIQFLEAQRELAARGLKKDQVLGFMEPAANLGMALDLSLPDSVRQMEGAIFGFKKDISTLEAATASARQTADIQVKAAKISGMKPEDLTEVYKFGATPARLAGVSEASMLAFGAISKKANMGGDEAGVAFRALIAAAVSPTSGGRTALRAAGLRYADYQRAPDRLAVAPFVGDVAERYGVKLDKVAQGALEKIFSNKAMIANPEKFTPAVVSALKEALSGTDAKSLKSIAGEAGRYRLGAMQGVDVNALISDLMIKLPGNLQLANALFGAKQGSRIANAFSDPETFRGYLDQLNNHSEGFSEKIATERMAGFDGAVSRFEGATKNFETAMGRAFDKPMTGGYDAAAKALQTFNELPDATHRLVGELGAASAAAVAFSGALRAFSIANRLDGGPGIKGPGLGGALGFLWKGAMLYNLGSDMWDPSNMGKIADAAHDRSKGLDSWARDNLPWFLGPDAHEHFENYLHRPEVGSYKDAPSGYGRDFTLGSGGGFSQSGRLQPPSNLGYMSNFDASRVAPGPMGRNEVNVTGDATIQNKLDITLAPSPDFIATIKKSVQDSVVVKLSSTGHAASQLGSSTPEAAAPSSGATP